MQYKDYYKILGVPKKATTEEIKQAYKKLAVRYHPDKNPGNAKAEAKFKEINEAKEVLTNPDNRSKYDMLGQRWKQYQRQQRQRPGRTYQSQPAGQPDPELNNIFTTFFEEIFGGGRNSRKRGKNYEANIKISLTEAYAGMQDVLSFNGKKLRIKIQPGIKNGQILRIKGQGAAGKNGAEPGDLFLKIMIKPHRQFSRRENDLFTEVPVDIFSVVLGKKVRIPSMKGDMHITIPPGTQSGEKLKLKGLGMPDYHNPDKKGDLYVMVTIRMPKRISEKERALWEQLYQLNQKK